jgi:undecaprenyl-diphosphatase
MSVWHALVLGILQGVSEFLPISSSAHLALAPWLFGWPDPGLAFDVALHVGTLVALVWYFRREWIALIRAFIRIVRRRRIDTAEEWQVVFLVTATVPALLAGLALGDRAETTFRSPALIAATLIVMGIVLWASDRWAGSDRPLRDMRWTDALWIGVSQAFALVPGVSRSGATITSGRLLRFDRQSAAVFSFLLSLPVIAGAAVLKAPEAFREAQNVGALVVGVVAAAASSAIAIAVLLRFVLRHSYGIFALYRVLLGIGVLVVIARGR